MYNIFARGEKKRILYKTIGEINAGWWCGGEVVQEKLQAVVIYNERVWPSAKSNAYFLF